MKAVVISDAPEAQLRSQLAELDLPRRALSYPIDLIPAPSLPSFVELWGEIDRLRHCIERWPGPLRAWLVNEFLPVSYERSWPSGQTSPGIRMVSTVYRRPDLSREAFEAHWRGPHAVVAKSYTVPVWHYSQNVVVEALGPDSDIDIDGFVGMHFRTAAEREARWRDYPEEAARGAADAAEFMAVERSVSITAIETVWEDEGKA